MPRRLTKEQLDYIKEHINDFPRTEVAREAGVTINTLYKYVRLLGGKNKQYISEEDKEEIRRLYPTMSAGEISERLGISVSSVVWQACKQGLTHDEETRKRIAYNRASSLRRYWNKENYSKKGRKQHLMRKKDELLVLSGMPQSTKLRLRTLSQRALNVKMYLRKSHNYFYSKDEPFVLCYDEDTKRSKKEEYYTEKFGFRFVNA